MIKEPFLSRYPSHFSKNPIVKAFLVSEGLLWSSWNFIFPILALFVVSRIGGGNVEVVAIAYSVYLIWRVLTELLSGKMLNKSSDKARLGISVLGMLILALGYIAFIFASSVMALYGVYSLLGIGLGISTPAKFALFSDHLDKTKASYEWGIYDAISLFGMAVAGIVGGYIANNFGFDLLFLTASIFCLAGVFPYVFIYYKKREN